MDPVALSRAWSAFERLSPGARSALRSLERFETFEAGDVVFEEGHETPFLGAVESGRVALRLRVPEIGHRVTIATIEPADLLGWSAVVAPYRATADAVVAEPTRIVAFDAVSLRELLEAREAVAAEVLPLVLETVSRRLTTSWHQLIDVFAPRSAGPW